MTLAHAEHILDIVGDALQQDEGLPYHPVSSLQGYDVFKIDTAFKLRVANDFLLFAAMGDPRGEFELEQRVNSWGSIPMLILSLFVQDAELDELRRLPTDSSEYIHRLMSIAPSPLHEKGFKDPRFASLETLSSFGTFCKRVGAMDPIYWQRIFTRLELTYSDNAPRGNDPDWTLV